MKLNFFLVILILALFIVGCSLFNKKPTPPEITPTNTTTEKIPEPYNTNSEPIVSKPTIELKTSPDIIDANKEVTLIFSIKDKDAAQIKDFKVIHEKKMHLIAVSADLSEFEHLHPELQSDGSFKLNHTFKHGGKFILYADATPENGSQIVERIELDVKGEIIPTEKLIAENSLTKQMDGISVTMKPDGELTSNKESNLIFVVTDDATGKPVSNLQNYLGELAHIVVISEDTKDFLHVHPTSNKTADQTSITAHTNFPNGGIYKLWIQFQRNNKIIAVPYILNVTKGAAKITTSAQTDNGSVKIKVNAAGFTPSTLSAKKGEPLKLVFLREDENNCGDEVVFPKLNINKKLQVGQDVTVEISPTETGKIAFSCGMNMLKGKILVQ